MLTKISVAISGLIVGGALVTGTALALGHTQPPASAPMTMSGSMGLTGTPATTQIMIRHVLRGCHVWTYRGHQAASMRLNLQHGGRLRIMDNDMDPHGLVQLAGPKLRLKGHMMMGQGQTIRFKQQGLYRFKTKVVEMGPEMEVKTIGPDNKLRLTVSVR